MFTSINKEHLRHTLQHYKSIIDIERAKYASYYTYIESGTNYVIADNIDHQYTLLCDRNIFPLSNNLINNLYDQHYIDHEYLHLICFAPDYIYKIMIKSRLLVTIMNVNYNIRVDLYQFINDKRMLQLSKHIKHLREHYNLTVHIDSYEPQQGQYEEHQPQLHGIHKHIWNSLLEQNANFIVVGDVALSLITNHNRINIIELISSDPKDIAVYLCENIKNAHNIELTYKKIRVNVLYDFRIKKYNIYHGKRIVACIFNTAKYELIPFITHDATQGNGIKIGDKFVLLAFWLIQLFSAYLIIHNGIITDDKMLVKHIKHAASATIALPYYTTGYYGIYRNELLSFKAKIKQIQQDNKRYIEYYPHIYKQFNDGLRSIN